MMTAPKRTGPTRISRTGILATAAGQNSGSRVKFVHLPNPGHPEEGLKNIVKWSMMASVFSYKIPLAY